MGEVLDAATRPQPSGRLFTVGIPVFNGKSLLRNCLQSVINSTLPRDRFEIVIADDGSSEPETLAILKEYENSLAADPGFFRVISLGTNSGGAARPRNRILDEATGEYVFFVDSDDTIGNLALERIAEAVAVTPADWIALNQVPVNGRALSFGPPAARRGAPHPGFGDAYGPQGLPTRRDRAPTAPVRRGTSPRRRCELRLLVHRERVAIPHARRIRLLLPHAARRQPRRTRPPLQARQHAGGTHREGRADPALDARGPADEQRSRIRTAGDHLPRRSAQGLDLPRVSQGDRRRGARCWDPGVATALQTARRSIGRGP